MALPRCDGGRSTHIKVKTATILQPHDFAHLVQEDWLAVGGKSHHLVLVAVMRKAEILGHRLVEHPERVRKMHTVFDVDHGAATGAPCGRREVTESVQSTLPLNGASGKAEDSSLSIECRFAWLRSQSSTNRRCGCSRTVNSIFFSKLARGLELTNDDIDVAERYASFIKTVSDRLAWEPGPMLDSAKPFLLGSGDDPAVPEDRSRAVTVIGVRPRMSILVGLQVIL